MQRLVSISMISVLLCLGGAVHSATTTQELKAGVKLNQKITVQKSQAQIKVMQGATRQSTVAPMARVQLAPVKAFKKAQLVRLQPIKPSTKKPEGPDPERYISLRDILEDQLLLKDIGEIAGWDGDMLFQDKAVGDLFYYVPRAFMLKHDSNGYAFGVQYNKQKEKDQPSVTLSMELSAQGKPGDLSLLKQILHEALELKPNEKVKLQSLSGTGISVEFDSLATGLAIDKERVHITPPKNLHDNLHITFSLTQDETESVFALIAHEGMIGSLQLPIGASKGGETKSQVSIPFKIKYSSFSGDPIAGFEQWWLDKQAIKKLKNVSSFPASISGINGYTVENGKLQRISKSFKKDTVLKPGAAKNIKLPDAKKVLGDNILVAWLDTKLETDCEKCAKQIKAQIDRGVSDNPTTPISFEAIPAVFEDMDLYKVIIRVKSPYYSVDRNKVEEQTLQLTEDENIATLAIYYPEKKNNPLLYRYKIKLVTNSGEEFSSKEWVDGRELTRIIGSSQLELILEQGEE